MCTCLDVCLCFLKLKTKFREIRNSWQFNEITRLNERIFFSCTLFIGGFFVCFNINCIKTLLIRLIIMEMAVQEIVAFVVILMNHSAIMILIMYSSSDIKTKVFLQTKKVTVL